MQPRNKAFVSMHGCCMYGATQLISCEFKLRAHGCRAFSTYVFSWARNETAFITRVVGWAHDKGPSQKGLLQSILDVRL